MKILIAETDPNIRYGLNIITEQVEDRIIMGEATTQEELLRCMFASCPDVLLISQVFPGLDDGSLLVELQQVCPSLIIIVMMVNLPGKEMNLPTHTRSNVEIIQKPEQLFRLLNKIHSTRETGNTEKT